MNGVAGGPSRGTARTAAAATVADTVAAVVLAVPGVAALHTGTFGEVATYLPGRRVDGVRIRPEVTEIHVVIEWRAPVLATADAIRLAVAPWVTGRVDVAVEDVVDSSLVGPGFFLAPEVRP